MRKNIIILVLVVIACSVKSQTIVITGLLADSITKSKLPYGNVILKNQNDSIITGVLSNEKGEFKFKNILYKKGMYILTKYMGYDDRKVNISLNSIIEINLGNLYLKQNTTQINEVTVAGNIKYIDQKFDRKVFKMNEGKVAAARTILDLLRTLPGVIVDDEGNVRYKGAGATIYVDDQPFEFVYPKIEMIPVDKVDRIELVDVAMQSGGSGKGGIINIRSKSVNTEGISGIASGNINTINFKNIYKSKAFINVNYKKKKITIFNNLSMDNSLDNSNYLTTKNITTFQIPTVYNSNSNFKANSRSFYYYAGVFYNPSQKTQFFLGSGIFANSINKSSNELISSMDRSNSETSDEYTKIGGSKIDQKSIGIRFSYKHSFDTTDTYIRLFGGFQIGNSILNDSARYYYSISNYKNIDSVYKNSTYFKEGSKRLYYNLFYNYAIAKDTRFNLNYLGDLTFDEYSRGDYYIFNVLNNQRSIDKVGSEQEHELSLRIGTKIKKWKVDVGINIDDKYINGKYKYFNSNNSDTTVYLKKNYFKILPSATIAFSINDSKELKLTLSQTSNLPWFYILSDFIDKTNLYFWRTGNSSLKPVDFYSVYLGYSYNKETINATAEYFFNYTNNEVTNVSIPLTSLLTLSKPENIAEQSNTGIDLSLWYKVNGNFNFSLSSSIFHTYFDSKTLVNTATYYNLAVDNLIKTQFGYNIKCSMEYKIKGFYTMFYFNYYAQELTFDGYNKAWFNSSFNISRKFLKNNLRILLGINNIFGHLVEHGSYSNNFGVENDTKIISSKYERTYFISIQYNLRQGDRGTKDLKIGG